MIPHFKVNMPVPKKIVSCTVDNALKVYPDLFPNKTLDFFQNKKLISLNKINVKKDKILIKFPVVFSLIKNYNESIKTIYKILNTRYHINSKELCLDFSYSKSVDLDAISLLSVILLNIQYERRSLKLSTIIDFDNDIVNLKLLAVGPLGKLQITTPDTKKSFEYLENLKTKCNSDSISYSDLFCGGRPMQFSKQTVVPYFKGNYENSIINFFNNSLNSFDLTLSVEGKRALKGMMGEITDNARQHLGREFDQFFCSAYYQKYADTLGKGQIAIFNFGQTIYEGLKYDSTQDSKKSLENNLEISKNILSTKFNEENFVTLSALQKSISREYVIGENNIRGTGTIKLISTFQNLNNPNLEELTMTIISGNTKIDFDGLDISKLKDGIIAFNENNNLREVPNEKYVYSISDYFPGTIILLKFYIDKSWTQEKIDKSW